MREDATPAASSAALAAAAGIRAAMPPITLREADLSEAFRSKGVVEGQPAGRCIETLRVTYPFMKERLAALTTSADSCMQQTVVRFRRRGERGVCSATPQFQPIGLGEVVAHLLLGADGDKPPHWHCIDACTQFCRFNI